MRDRKQKQWEEKKRGSKSLTAGYKPSEGGGTPNMSLAQEKEGNKGRENIWKKVQRSGL